MPSGYRPGIPQSDQAYTKWDADRDEVEVDFKQLDQKSKSRSWFSGPKGTVLKILLILATFLIGLIIGYIIRRSVRETIHVQGPYYTEGYERYSKDVSQMATSFLDVDNIRDNLRNYTSQVHLTGTRQNNLLKLYLKEQMSSYGLLTTEAKYRVALSYPIWTETNTIRLLSENGSVEFNTSYHGPDHLRHPELTTPYLAFTPSGDVTADLVYVNYGEESDFEQVGCEELCKGNIVLMRYGKIYRGDMVHNAQNCGAIGAILYSDPDDVTHHMTSEKDVYPYTWYMPGWAVQRGTTLLGPGDPASPGLPAIDGIHRISLSQANLPKIPAKPIGYDDAQELMKFMDGRLFQHFMGNMNSNVTYKVGPGYTAPRKNWKVQLELNNEIETREISNVMGVIKGHEEPDRYVIVGVHYDAWTYGASDPNIGTASMMEIARVFSEMKNKGWKPRRTILFMCWDAEEQGLMGSHEWVEEHMKQLAERTVAYINLDAFIRGNYSLRVSATPEMSHLIQNVTKMFSPADKSEGEENMYQQWVRRSGDGDNPMIWDVDGSSDQAAFLFLLGVPVVWPRYMHDTSIMKKYPAYHTDFDDFDYQSKFIDPGFKAADTLTRMVTELLLQLSCLTRLPLDVRGLARKVSDGYNSLQSALPLKEKSNMLDPLHWAIGNFTQVADTFYDNFQQVDIADVLQTTRYNDRAMKVSQSFIHPDGLPGRPQMKNILFAPSIHNSNSGSTFSGIVDAYQIYTNAVTNSQNNTELLWQEFEKHMSIATLAVHQATDFLSEEYFP